MSLVPSIYSSDDVGAPVLTGLAGSMAALLDAVLVTGYGVGAGAKAGLGWTRPYTGTNLRAYRSSAVSGLGHYLRLDDTQVRVARMRTYTAMTAISTGSNLAPTTAQRTNGALWVKSDTNDAVARKWWMIGNERCFYLFIAPVGSDVTGDTGIKVATPYFAGQLQSRKPGDQFCFALSPGLNTYAAGDWSGMLSSLFRNVGVTTTWQGGIAGSDQSSLFYNSVVITRGYAQVGNPVAARIASDPSGNSADWGGGGSGAVPYPDPISGGLLMARPPLIEGVNLARGYFPGIYVPMHALPFDDLHVETGIPGMPAGTKLLAKTCSHGLGSGTGTQSQVLFDISNAW